MHHTIYFTRLFIVAIALSIGLSNVALAYPAGFNPLDPTTYYKLSIDPSAVLPATQITKSSDTLVNRTLCIWDVMGQNGEVISAFKDYQVMGKTLGINFIIKSYTDEKIASEDFRVKHCDAVVVTGLRARPYNGYTGSIEAIAGLQNTQQMRALVKVLSNTRQADLMRTTFAEEHYEIAGVMPFGTAYPFVNDKKINNVREVAGKRIAVFDYDKAQAKLVKTLGATPFPSDVTNFSTKFNSGAVDIVYAPLLAYSPLELYKGMGNKGGILDYPLAYVSLQLIIHPTRFPAGFGQQSRDYIYSQFDRFSQIIQRYEDMVDAKYWIRITPQEKINYDLMSRESRISLIKDDIYDRRLLNILKKIRCSQQPSHPECAMAAE